MNPPMLSDVVRLDTGRTTCVQPVVPTGVTMADIEPNPQFVSVSIQKSNPKVPKPVVAEPGSYRTSMEKEEKSAVGRPTPELKIVPLKGRASANPASLS